MDNYVTLEISKAKNFYNNGEFDKARNIYSMLYKKYPKNSEVIFLFAMIHYKLKKYDYAIKLLEKLNIEENLSYILILTKIFYEIGYLDKAEKILIKIIEIDNSQLEARYQLANIYYAKKMISKAVEELAKISSKQYKNTDLKLSLMLHELKRNESALEFINKSLESNADYSEKICIKIKILKSLKKYI